MLGCSSILGPTMIATLLLTLALQDADGPIRTAPQPVIVAVETTAPVPTTTSPPTQVPFDWSARGGDTPRPAVLDYDREGRLIAPPSNPVDDDDYVNPWLGVPRSSDYDPSEGNYSRSVEPVAGTVSRTRIPTWALSDNARWERQQCGDDTTEAASACRRAARNQLAMARAGLASEPQPSREHRDVARTWTPDDAAGPCRRTSQTSADGTTTSSSLVCGSGDVEPLLESMNSLSDRTGPQNAETCSRPRDGEDTTAWVARCGSGRP